MTISCNFLLVLGLRHSYYGFSRQGGVKLLQQISAAVTTPSSPYQNYSSCTLTLVLLKIQLRGINIDSNKKKDKIGLGCGQYL